MSVFGLSNGNPMAATVVPGDGSPSAKENTCPGTGLLSRSSARSVTGSMPITRAGSGPVGTSTATALAPSTTCAAVATVWASSRNPVPMPSPSQLVARIRSTPDSTSSYVLAKSAGTSVGSTGSVVSGAGPAGEGSGSGVARCSPGSAAGDPSSCWASSVAPVAVPAMTSTSTTTSAIHTPAPHRLRGGGWNDGSGWPHG